MRTLLIDNYDSYTYNLSHLLAQVCGEPPTVLVNDAPELARLSGEHAAEAAFDAIVISPGPGRPERARDVGHIPTLLRDCRLPVLGVCLGHQAIGLLAGAQVTPAPTPRHGFLERITHTGAELFAGLPQGFAAVRYHSLCLAEPLPPELTPTAWADDGVLMALRHQRLPRWGVQFHPESVATEHGRRLLANFRDLATATRPATRTAATGPAPIRAGSGAPPKPAAGQRADAQSGWRVEHRRLPFAVDAERAFASLFGHSRHAFWLDTSRPSPPRARFSFLGETAGPHAEVLRFTLDPDGRSGLGTLRAETAAGVRVERGDVFELLDARLRERHVPRVQALPFDPCGYVGFFGYELRAAVGAPRPRRPGEGQDGPDAVWLAATRMVAIDHLAGVSWVLALRREPSQGGHDPADRDARGWLEMATTRLAMQGAARPDLRHEHGPDPDLDGDLPDPEAYLTRSQPEYQADVARCQRALRAGESYEICLTNRVRMPFAGSPFALYRRQRRRNPAPYAAYLRLGETSVLCASPERFLAVDEAGVAESRPIKGTAPRHADPALDAALRAGLAASAKDRAENLMIVDLVRNDLGRVCEPGSVRVRDFLRVESYPTAHQLVSTVRGRLRPEVSAPLAARACFPPGSMTGAPKLRAMELLAQIEGEPRGVYAGALGYFGLGGTADLNVVIRTMTVRAGVLRAGAGGAVVLDSDPAGEYAEMLLKARASLASRDLPTPEPDPSARPSASWAR